MSLDADETAAEPAVAPPPERFNFAQHLILCNAARPHKLAFLDDTGRLSYGGKMSKTVLLLFVLLLAAACVPGQDPSKPSLREGSTNNSAIW
jgi:hypothetical protein